MQKRMHWGRLLVAAIGLLGFGQALAAPAWTYPPEQAWQVAQGRPVPGVTVPADLAGIPAILRRSRLYLLPNAVVMPSVNSWGAFSVRPGCFRAAGAELTFYPLEERLEKKSGFVFRNVGSDRMQLVLDGMFEFDLERTTFNAQAEEDLHQFRAVYNKQAGFDKGAGSERVLKECRIAPLKPKHPPADRDLQVNYPALKTSKTFAGHAPDPVTPIGLDSSHPVSYERLTAADTVVRGCQGKLRQREARYRDRVLYIMQSVSGTAVDDRTPCSRAEQVWTIDEAVVKVLLPADPAFKPSLSLRHIDKKGAPGEYFFEIQAEGHRKEKKGFDRVYYIMKLADLDQASPTLELLETRSKCFWCR